MACWSYAVTKIMCEDARVSSIRRLARHALELQLVMRPVNRPQPPVHVAQTDAVAEGALQPLLGHPQSIVVHLDDRMTVSHHAADGDPAATDFARQTMFDRVLD